MDCLVADKSFVADLDAQGIEENQWVDRLQGVEPAGGDPIHRIGDRAGQVRRDLDAVQIAQMPDNLARAHAAGVHRDDLVIEPRETALVFGDQLRVETGLAVTRNLQLDRARVGDDRLLTVTVPPVAGLIAGKVMVHLGVENPFG